jgi:hypothetical protein
VCVAEEQCQQLSPSGWCCACAGLDASHTAPKDAALDRDPNHGQQSHEGSEGYADEGSADEQSESRNVGAERRTITQEKKGRECKDEAENGGE